MPFVYVAGMWMAVVSSIAFTGVYAWRVAEEARLLANALDGTELVLQREQHLSALDGLAAAAAHELGTPLATIALVAKEMERALGNDPRYKEDVTLLRSQSERCREILKRLTSLSSEGETHADAAAADLADRGGDRAASRFRHRDQRSSRASGAGRSRSAGAIPASSTGSAIWSRTPSISPSRDVTRALALERPGSVAIDDRRRRTGFPAGHHRPHRRALYVDAPGHRAAAAAWASACSSPRRCSSARGDLDPFRNSQRARRGRDRSRSSGRATAFAGDLRRWRRRR